MNGRSRPPGAAPESTARTTTRTVAPAADIHAWSGVHLGDGRVTSIAALRGYPGAVDSPSADERFMAEWAARWHEPPPGVPDGQRCIQCRVPARDGRISHARACPEYRPTRRTGPVGHPGTGMCPRDAYDRFTATLRMRRPDRYDCPSCGAPGDGHGLKVDLVGERVLFHCFSCHGGQEILDAVGMCWDDLGGEP